MNSFSNCTDNYYNLYNYLKIVYVDKLKRRYTNSS
ncbi:hypothetical protein LCUFL03_P20011 [Latilactobacillus curvatus]|nr:hypothetical protein LCUFL03_P20011 [Latilactobacillus curvatus]